MNDSLNRVRSRWISVKTRVPNPPSRAWPHRYLVTNGIKTWVETAHPSWWNTKDKRGREFWGPKVTHWMTLPKLPHERAR